VDIAYLSDLQKGVLLFQQKIRSMVKEFDDG